METSVNLGSVNFTHLALLQSLTIHTPFDNFVFDRRINFSVSSQAVFQPLSKLINLEISISWEFSEPMTEMFSYLSSLKVLDLSYTRFINYDSLQRSFKGLKGNSVLHKLVLKNTQTFTTLTNGLTFNLSHFLEPIAHCSLQSLDLSYNSLKFFYPGLIRFAPNLTEIIITNNLFFAIFPSAFILEVILHPRLEIADLSEQGHRANTPSYPSLPIELQIPSIASIASHDTAAWKMPPEESLTLKTSIEERQDKCKISVFFKMVGKIKTSPAKLVGLMGNSNISLHNIDNIHFCSDDVCNIFNNKCKFILDFFSRES